MPTFGLLVAGALSLASCGSSGGGTTAPGGAGTNNGNAELVAVRFGRNAQILGYRAVGNGFVIESFANDVLIGPDIQDERPPGSTRRDSEILYDFLQADLATLTPRVLIPREIGSVEFQDAFDALDDRAQRVTPAIFGDDTNAQPFTVIPRNAAIELEFSESLGITEDFFVVRDENGTITGQRNTEAVQLLEIRGDPNDNDPTGDFRIINARFVPNGNRLLIDPVLLGIEGPNLQLRNNASGLPESSDLVGANIRLALALEGPLQIPGIFQPENSRFTGLNNTGERSVIRDFRSGNRDDTGSDIARGFVRDPEPPRLIGEIVMRLARVDQPSASQQTITIFKNGVVHELDLGDGIRVVDPVTGSQIGPASEIVAEPTDDASDPAVQSVRTRINPIAGLEQFDPQNDPNFPIGDPNAQAAFLAANAPIVVVVTEYNAVRASRLSNPMLPPGDDIANFVRFSPASLPNLDGSPNLPNENISPFAEAIVRFTKPVDLTTVRAYDSFFFAARNVVDEDLIETDFTAPRGIDIDSFNFDKFATPHLVAARVIDEDGSQTRVRLQPQKGFYLDDAMRQADAAAIAALPAGETLLPEDRPFPYYVHLVSGQEGIRDLTGNPIDFNAESGVVDFEVLPFAVDTRTDNQGRPIFADNLVVSVVSRFADEDEDARPSVFRYNDNEQPLLANPTSSPAEAEPYTDFFGDVTYLTDGRLIGRTASRFRRVVDNLNQTAAPPQRTYLQFCPDNVGDSQGTGTTSSAPASPTGSAPFGQGIQNPLNPAGARLQTVWREIDLSLSRLNPTDFDLDVEQMYWAPFQGTPISFDQFDSVSLFLGHSEFRVNPCIGEFSAGAVLRGSGLAVDFDDNYVRNRLPGVNQTEESEQPHPAYVNQVLTIQAADAITEVNGVNRFLPLPDFQEPFFVWRDQTMMLQGGNQQKGNDVLRASNGTPGNLSLRTFIPTPWLGGFGAGLIDNANAIERATVVWQSSQNFRFSNTGQRESFTDGLVSSIALPLLADFQTACDDPELPAGGGFVATGFNGWQVSLAVQSEPTPNFRAFSGGFIGNAQNPAVCVAPGTSRFSRASGGFTPAGATVGPSRDNSVYWVMADFARRQAVATFGFIDILDPHRRAQGGVGAQTAPTGIDVDPRLGPFFFDGGLGRPVLPNDRAPAYDFAFEPPLSRLPGGTSIVPEFRGAGEVSDLPWRWDRKRGTLTVYRLNNQPSPSTVNFPNDPLKACDAHIRKFDDRPLPSGVARNFWTYYYNDTVTDYTTNIFDLSNDTWLGQFAGANEEFRVDDVRYLNWRFIMASNINSNPPIAPSIESFAISYRFESR